MKDEFLANLVATNKRVPNSKLVHEIDSDNLNINSETIKNNSASEGLSLMDMMMAAHIEAKNEQATVKKKEAMKTFGGGFKKGFLGDKKTVNEMKVKQVSEKNTYLSWIQNKPVEIDICTEIDTENSNSDTTPIPNIKTEPSTSSDLKSNNYDIPTIKKNKKSDLSRVPSSFTADVQKAISDEEPPMLKQLKQGDWVTPDLLQIFNENLIIKNGLKNPKCSAALQMMQNDSKEAKKHFQGDPDVDLFLREFGRVMSNHFNQLASSNNDESNGSTDKNNLKGVNSNDDNRSDQKVISKISEIEIDSKNNGKNSKKKDSNTDAFGYGVLQAEAIKRHRYIYCHKRISYSQYMSL